MAQVYMGAPVSISQTAENHKFRQSGIMSQHFIIHWKIKGDVNEELMKGNYNLRTFTFWLLNFLNKLIISVGTNMIV